MALSKYPYNPVILFSEDKELSMVTGGTHVIGLSQGVNLNGNSVILKFNTPVGITFGSQFEATSDSAAVDPTKLNVVFCTYFSNWNGSGSDKVLYKNNLFTAV